MKKLYLVRHAKSSWKYKNLSDLDRPLKGRGMTDALHTSKWLLQESVEPDLILSSPATRALHTALIFARTLGYPFSDMIIEEDIYGASPNDLLRIVKDIDDSFESVMLFGHNPTITTFSNRFLNHTIDNIPTTGIVCLRFDHESWEDIGKNAELVFFDYPKKRVPRSKEID